jgi:hypothetical protein
MTTNLPATKLKFAPTLAFDEAMTIINRLSGKPDAWTDEDLFAIYGYTPEQLEQFRTDTEFTKAVHAAIQELKETGGSLKQKSRMQLDYYIDSVVPQMMSEPNELVPAKDKIALLQFLSKLSGMDTEKPKEGQGGSQTNSPVFNLILTQAPEQQPKLIVDQQ